MFVIGRIELRLLDHAEQMGELQRDRSTRFQSRRKTSGEIIDVRYMRENIVADDEIRPFAFRA